MTRRRKVVVFGTLGLVVVVVVAAGALGRRDRGTEVRIEEVARRDLVATVTASGRISPKTAVDIASDITGRIILIPVEEGQYVQKDDLLLRIDPTQYEATEARAQATLSATQAQALQAKVNRDQAKRALDRAMELRNVDPPLVSDEQLEQAQQNFDVSEALALSQEHQVAQARASLREARDQLAKTTLRAPMAGKITRMAVEEGEVALASTFSRETGLLMTISDLSVIQVNVRVDETDVVRLQLGDSAEISIDAFADTTFVGRVTKISQSAIQGSAATSATGDDRAVDYDVEITLENPPPDIRPDLSATAKVVTDTRNDALSIPIIALTVREHARRGTELVPGDTVLEDTEGVFVVNQGLAQFRPVTVGIAGEEHFEVIAGLNVGDSIVAGPYQTIRDLGDSTVVRPIPTEGRPDGGRAASTAAEPAPPSGQAMVSPEPDSTAVASEIVRAPPAAVRLAPSYGVQVAAVRTRRAADELMQRLSEAGYAPHVVEDADGLFKVRVGKFATRAETEALVSELKAKVGGNPFIVENL